MKYCFYKPHEVLDLTTKEFTYQTNKTNVKFLIKTLCRHLVPQLIEVIAVVLEVKVWIYFSVM